MDDFGDAEAPLVMPTEARHLAASSRPPGRQGGAGPEAAKAAASQAQPTRRIRPLPGGVRGASVQKQLEVVEAALEAARAQLDAEVEARCSAEHLRAQAVRRLEEYELERIDFEAEREQWRQREAHLEDAARSSAAGCGDVPGSEHRIAELEALLKQAILKGAQLGRAHADAEAARAIAERRLLRLKGQARQRLENERQRADEAEARAERAEARMMEYLEAAMRDADAVVEAHVKHLVEVGHGLARKVEEQAEIIEVMRDLLQDHKDFIRQECGSENASGVDALSSGATAPSAVAPAAGSSKLRSSQRGSANEERDCAGPNAL